MAELGIFYFILVIMIKVHLVLSGQFLKYTTGTHFVSEKKVNTPRTTLRSVGFVLKISILNLKLSTNRQ